jgi:predicted RNA-binding protein YlqC (UPF0109 family)
VIDRCARAKTSFNNRIVRSNFLMNTTTTATRIEKVMRSLINSLIDHPQDLELEVEPMVNVISARARVNMADMGMIIGQGGRTVRALDAVIGFMATQAGYRAEPFRPDEPSVGHPKQSVPMTVQHDFNAEPTRAWLHGVVLDIMGECEVSHRTSGKISTAFTITTAANVSDQALALLADALNTLVHAHGKAKHGRQLFVTIKRDEQQPSKAATNDELTDAAPKTPEFAATQSRHSVQ